MPVLIPGKVVVVAAGTPVNLYDAIRAAHPTDKAYAFKAFHAVSFQAWKGNSGQVYIGGSDMVKATGVGVAAVLVIPTATYIPTIGMANQLNPAGVDLTALYLDADVAGEGVLVALLTS